MSDDGMKTLMEALSDLCEVVSYAQHPAKHALAILDTITAGALRSRKLKPLHIAHSQMEEGFEMIVGAACALDHVIEELKRINMEEVFEA